MEQYKTDIIIDLETAPSSNCMDYFDPFKVKLGNAKDPEKVKAIRDKAKAKFKQDSTLNPKTAYICAIGVKSEQLTATLYAKDESEEKAILEALWTCLPEHKQDRFTEVRFNAWNADFDQMFLVQRCWKNRIKVKDIYFDKHTKYWRCVMKAFCCYQYGATCSLADAAKFLGVNQPREHNIKGADFWKHLRDDPKQAEKYLLDDLQEEWDIMNLIY